MNGIKDSISGPVVVNSIELYFGWVREQMRGE